MIMIAPFYFVSTLASIAENSGDVTSMLLSSDGAVTVTRI